MIRTTSKTAGWFTGHGFARFFSLGGASAVVGLFVVGLVTWAFVTGPGPWSGGGADAAGSATAGPGLMCGSPEAAAWLAGSGADRERAEAVGTRSHADFFTNGGRYMQRIHCMPGADGRPD
ncbi:MAG: hypothetical protein AAFX76_03770 [Planctomycetota bacterium]